MSKLETNKREKKDALLKAAFDLFIKNGINKTSISDISSKAGVAKGTFYLYFKDKYDIRNHLIANKADQLFLHAYDALKQTDITTFQYKIIFLVDHIVDQLDKDKSLMLFISKHLSWGIFKNVLISSGENSGNSVYQMYERLLRESGYSFENPEIMIYLIIELISGASYSAILYQQPVPIKKLKPYLYKHIRYIIDSSIIKKRRKITGCSC